jgi:hypothetical protein
MGFEQLAIQFAKGDRYARRDVFTYAPLLGVDLQAKELSRRRSESTIRRSWMPSYGASSRRRVPGLMIM